MVIMLEDSGSKDSGEEDELFLQEVAQGLHSILNNADRFG